MNSLFQIPIRTDTILSIILLIILNTNLFFAANLKSDLRGTIIDSETSEPIPAAVINITGTEYYFTSNKNGEFFIPSLEGEVFKLKVTHLAYQENYFEIDLGKDAVKTIKIYLTPKSIEISPVVVTDKNINSKFEELNEAAGVLKGKELQRDLGQTLASTLKNETGLAVRSMGPAPARPVIRGLGGTRVFMSEDGVKTVDLSATSPDHAVTIEPFSVNRIEVMRGPKSLIKTPVTIGGVVNVVRDEIPEEKHEIIHGSAGTYYETANEGYLGSVNLTAPLNNFVLRGEVSGRKANDLETPIGRLNNSYSENRNYSLGGSYIFDKGFIGASFRKFDLNYGVPGGFIGAHPEGVDIEMYRNQLNLKGKMNFADGFLNNLEFNGSRALYRHKEFEASGRIGSEFKIISNLGYINLHHKSIFFLNNGIIGTSIEHRDLTIGGFVFTPPSKSLNFSSYIFENFNITHFSFEFAARYDYNRITPESSDPDAKIGFIREREFNTFSLSFSTLYEFSKLVYLGANLSKSSRTPTIEELYSEGPHLAAYSYEIGNPDLKAESGIGAEIFAYHKFENLFFNVNLFYNYLDNYIIPRNSGEINFATFLPVYSSSGVAAALYGIETQIDWKIINKISLDNSVSFTKGIFRDSSDPLPNIPPLKGKLGIRYTGDNYGIGISTEWAAEQNEVDEFEEPTKGYATLNLSGQYSFNTGSFIHSLVLNIDNIFDKEYRNHLSRVKSILPESGRNFRLIYRIYF